MNILLVGAGGFLGRHLEAALVEAGHSVVRALRSPVRPQDVAVDFRVDLRPEIWRPRLSGIDQVINAVGILNERAPGDFERIHHRAPAALFAACAQAGISRIIQISALNAERADTPYLASKAAADQALLAHCPEGIVLRPSLVFGPGGASSDFFMMLASLPVLALPGRAGARLAPIHVDDLAAWVVRLVADPSGARILEAAGPETLSYQQLLTRYRAGLGFSPAFAFRLPESLMALAARLGDHFPGVLFNRASWKMLRAGSAAGPEHVTARLGYAPRPPAAFIPPAEAPVLRERALSAWRTPLFQWVIAFLWLWSGAVSLLWPDTGLELLGALRLSGIQASLVLIGAATLDLGLGLLCLARPGRRVWLGQIALVSLYSLIAALFLPAQLLHPFAPIAKNLVFLAVLFVLFSEEKKP